jgi:IS30 family transposase
VNDRLGGYVKLSITDRREAARELAEEGHSTREIGEVLGVGNATVWRDIVPNETQPAQRKQDFEDSAVSDETTLDAIAALSATEDVRAAAAKKKRKADRTTERREADRVGFVISHIADMARDLEKAYAEAFQS